MQLLSVRVPFYQKFKFSIRQIYFWGNSDFPEIRVRFLRKIALFSRKIFSIDFPIKTQTETTELTQFN